MTLLATFIGNTFGPNTPIFPTIQIPSHPDLPNSRNQASLTLLSSPTSSSLKLYISHVLSTVSQPNFIKPLPTNINLTLLEHQAIHSFRFNPHILNLLADKDSTTVVLNKDDYLVEATVSYPNVLLTTSSLMTLLTSTTTGPLLGLSAQDISFLLIPNPHTPILCILPKTHKPHNPDFPIVSS